MREKKIEMMKGCRWAYWTTILTFLLHSPSILSAVSFPSEPQESPDPGDSEPSSLNSDEDGGESDSFGNSVECVDSLPFPSSPSQPVDEGLEVIIFYQGIIYDFLFISLKISFNYSQS